MSAAGYELRGVYGTEPYWPEKKLKICVTGAGGFIASHLAKRLKEEGHHVVGVDWKRNEHMPVSTSEREIEHKTIAAAPGRDRRTACMIAEGKAGVTRTFLRWFARGVAILY